MLNLSSWSKNEFLNSLNFIIQVKKTHNGFRTYFPILIYLLPFRVVLKCYQWLYYWQTLLFQPFRFDLQFAVILKPSATLIVEYSKQYKIIFWLPDISMHLRWVKYTIFRFRLVSNILYTKSFDNTVEALFLFFTFFISKNVA